VIRARDVRKTYRLYSSRADRLLDMVGLRRGGRPEFAALDGVSLDIARGEKVAIIGRNGAGKSTFLKLVSRVTHPTSGTMEVAGKVHALLQIGTGFHPDFTGRQNVYAYFAQLGLSRSEAHRRFEGVVEFAELTEYIDQPVATYSTGMAVRLMFATSTAITPDLLLLDEVLGVGDAYFAQKSLDRIRGLCAGEGTTLLLVTHDLYSAARVCDRIVWLDRGRILLDGDAALVVKAYEESIRHQEEERLRQEKKGRLRTALSSQESTRPCAILEISHAGAGFLPASVYFSRIELCEGNRRIAAAPIGAGAFDQSRPSHLDAGASSWGEETEWNGRLARPFLNFGSPFHKVVAALALDEDPRDGLTLSVVADAWVAERSSVEVRLFVGDRAFRSELVTLEPGGWRSIASPLRPASGSELVREVTGVHGTGAIAITDVTTRDAAGVEAFVFEHGGPFMVEIGFRVQQPNLREHAQALVAFLKDGIQDVCRIVTRDLLFDALVAREGAIRVSVPRLALAPGKYSVSVLLAREGYYERQQAKYFAVNPEVHACLSRVVDISVQGGGGVAVGTVVVVEGDWSVAAAAGRES
jgi:homopolymeric O-antigen transport system ATP-binding protein